ncbi:MAG: hypothetical protein K0S07_384 [Chlamydiales bacterium]|jgi:translocation and assembly module TamA|nr:hypothetical protein [Chlamydiales bacterium]
MLRVFFLCLLLFVVGLEGVERKLRVEIEGVHDEEIKSFLKELAKKRYDGSGPAPSAALLARRAESDIHTLLEYLKSQSYFSAHIDYSIDAEKDPPRLKYSVHLGPAYPIEEITIQGSPPLSKVLFLDVLLAKEKAQSLDYPYNLLSLKKIGLQKKDPAKASLILFAEKQIESTLKDAGYPFARVIDRKVLVDVEKKTASVGYLVTSGPELKFGQIEIKGLETIQERLLCKKIAWREGQLYRESLVRKTQEKLDSTGLFQIVNISSGKEELGQLPMEITVAESPQKLIGAGISYSAEQSFGLNVEWAHQNMRGLGETLNTSFDLSKQRQKGSIGYLQPDFMKVDQDLLWLCEYEKKKEELYDEISTTLSSILEQDVTPKFNYSIGGAIEFLRSLPSKNPSLPPPPKKKLDNFTLFKVPILLRWSNTNIKLQPTQGVVLMASLTPTRQIIRPNFFYLNTMLTGIVYRPLNKSHSLSLATKLKVGSMAFLSRNPLSRDNIPKSKLVYSGGEDTLRGYSNEKVCPLVDDGSIDGILKGGYSLAALSFELRGRKTKDWGWVIFYEVGNVFASTTPHIDRKMLQSAGIGVRYLTPIGPLRFDVAMPLNRRKYLQGGWIDHAYELYFNIGHTF